MAISVAVAVGDEVADKLVATLAAETKKLKIGAGELAKTELCPLATPQHLEKVKSYVTLGKQEGATLVVDGSGYQHQAEPKGFFMGGCLFDNVKPTMKIYKDEIFGPVLCVVRVKDFDEAIQLINAHEYANGTAIFTRDGYAARTSRKKFKWAGWC